jgi:hypothetical protein
MKEESFESYIKEKLEQYDSGAPMHVWERIKKEKEERKYGFFFLKRYGWFLILAPIIMGVGYFLYNSFSDTTAVPVASVPSQAEPTPASKQVSSVPNHQAVSEQTVSDPVYATTEHSVTERSTDRKVGTGDEHIASGSSPSKGDGVAYNPVLQEPKSTVLKVKPRVQWNHNRKQQTERQNLQVSHAPLDGAAFNLGYLRQENKYVNPFQIHPLQTSVKTLLPGCAPLRTGRNDLYLEVYAGPDRSIRNFSSTARPANYITQRMSVENNRMGYSIGVRLSKTMGERTLMKTGVNYSQINEQMKLVTEKEKRLTQIISIRIVVRAPGDTLRVRDTSYFEQTGTNYRTTYNRFRFVDVPVLFSYEFGNQDRISFALTAGLVFNIVSFYKGEVLDTSFLPVPITTREGKGVNNWRSNIGYGFYAGLTIQKYVSPNLNAFAEPYIRYNVTPVSQNDSYIQQRYSVFGLQLGVRYNLFANRQR